MKSRMLAMLAARVSVTSFNAAGAESVTTRGCSAEDQSECGEPGPDCHGDWGPLTKLRLR